MCSPTAIEDAESLIDAAINEDITYQSKPLDLRNQRTYAVKVCQIAIENTVDKELNATQAGVNGLLDVARTSYKEANADAFELATQLGGSKAPRTLQNFTKFH